MLLDVVLGSFVAGPPLTERLKRSAGATKARCLGADDRSSQVGDVRSPTARADKADIFSKARSK